MDDKQSPITTSGTSLEQTSPVKPASPGPETTPTDVGGPVINAAQASSFGGNVGNTKNHKFSLMLFVGLIAVLALATAGYFLISHGSKTSLATTTTHGSTASTQTSSSCSNHATQQPSYTSSDGGFKSWFPESPTNDPSQWSRLDLPSNTGGNTVILTSSNYWSYSSPSSAYGIPAYEVYLWAIPTADTYTLTQVADTIASNAKLAGSQVLLNKPTEVGSNPAVVLLLHTPASSDSNSPDEYSCSLVTLNKSSIYEVMMTSPQQNDPNMSKFLGSFRLNN